MNLQPGSNRDISLELQSACLALLNTLPRGGPFLPSHDTVKLEGRLCSLSIAPPRPGSTDTWEKIIYTTQVAIELHVGSVAAGWEIILSSRVRICFGHVPGPSIDTYIFNPSMRVYTHTDIVPRYIPSTEFILGNLAQSGSALRYLGQSGLAPGVRLGTGVRVPFWAASQIPLDDCENVIGHLTMISWFVERTGWTPMKAYTKHVGRCSIGIYLTFPRLQYYQPRIEPGRFGRTNRLRVGVAKSARESMRNTVQKARDGGIIDLPDGLQIFLYERSYIDPENICSRLNRTSLKDCFENRAHAMAMARLP